MEEYLTTAVLHKNSILMQIEKIKEKYYLFMAVGIPTTDTNPNEVKPASSQHF